MDSLPFFSISVFLLAVVAIAESASIPASWGGALLLLAIGIVVISAVSGNDPDKINARIMFFAGLGLFGFIGPLLTGIFDTYPGDFASLREPLALMLVVSQAVWLGTRNISDEAAPVPISDSPGRSQKLNTVLAGFIAIAITTLAGANSSGSVVSQTTTSFALASIVFSAVQIGQLQLPFRRRVLSSMLTLVAAGLYALWVFQGGGRLILLSLFAAVLWTAAPKLRFGRRRILVLALVLGLPFASAIEQSRLQEDFAVTSVGVGSFDEGLASVVNPVRMLDVMLDHQNGEAYSLGSSITVDRPQPLGSVFLTPAVAPIPRAIWPEKPVLFGRLLVNFYDPQLAARVPQQSFAGTFLGEFIYSFGVWIGVPLAAAFSIMVVRGIDRLYRRAKSYQDPYLLTLSVLLAVNLPDFVWAGFGTFAVRGFFSGMALVLVGGFLRAAARSNHHVSRQDLVSART